MPVVHFPTIRGAVSTSTAFLMANTKIIVADAKAHAITHGTVQEGRTIESKGFSQRQTCTKKTGWAIWWNEHDRSEDSGCT